MSLGVYPHISLQEARERAAEAATYSSKAPTPAPNVAMTSCDSRRPGSTPSGEPWSTGTNSKAESGRSNATLRKIRDYLDKDLLPTLGEKQLELISRSDCAKMQASIEKRGAFNVADKARTWLKQIFSQAIARDLCEYNPASELHAIAITRCLFMALLGRRNGQSFGYDRQRSHAGPQALKDLFGGGH